MSRPRIENLPARIMPCPGRRSVLMGAAAMSLAMAGCSAKPPLRIGFLGGLSGRTSDLGIAGRNGTEFALEEINAAGGLAGRKLELTSRDDEQSADKARQSLLELYASGVELIIGPMTSSVAAAVMPLVLQRGIPMISPLAGANDFSGKNDAFFRVVSDSATSGRQQGEALSTRGLRRLVTVSDTRNAVFTLNWCSNAAQGFSRTGGKLLQEIAFNAAPGLRFLELAQRIVATRADCVVIAASAADSAVLVQHVRAQRPELFIALSVWAGTEDLPALGGRALEGVMVTQFFDRFSPAPRWQAFEARYRQRFGDAAGYSAINGYDAMQMGAQAIRTQGPDGLLASLRRIRQLDGLQRSLTFDEYGDCLAPTFLVEIKNGQYAALKA